MKRNRLYFSIIALALSLTSCGGSSNNEASLAPLKELFEQLNEDYNFTLESVNEASTRRKIEVFSKYNYYYSYQTRVTSGSSGLFYIEGQGVQDYEIVNDQVNVLFHEGMGKVDVVEVFAHDDRGSQFAHIPMSSFLSLNYKKFKKEGDSFVSKDKDVNRVFVYYTNNYFANWEKGNEEAYIDFTKSKTTITILKNKVKVNFLPKVRNVGFDYTDDGSDLTISKIGTTSNAAVEAYIANPDPLTKKSSYNFDATKYEATFGNAVIPFSSKYSAYLDVLEYYSDKAINIYDIDFEDGLVEDIISNLPSDWKEASEDAEYWTTEYGFTVHAYSMVAQVPETVEGVVVTNDVEVYFLFGISPVELEDTEAGKILRPNGYFIGQLYIKEGEQVIEGSDSINEFFSGIGIDELLPDFGRYRSLSPSMRDYSENPVIHASFEMQGLYLFGYYVITLNNVTSSNIGTVTGYLKSDFEKISFYSKVTLDENYNLTVEPDFEAFAEDGTFPIQAVGSPLKNDDEIYGYQLIIISFTTLE